MSKRTANEPHANEGGTTRTKHTKVKTDRSLLWKHMAGLMHCHLAIYLKDTLKYNGDTSLEDLEAAVDDFGETLSNLTHQDTEEGGFDEWFTPVRQAFVVRDALLRDYGSGKLYSLGKKCMAVLDEDDAFKPSTLRDYLGDTVLVAPVAAPRPSAHEGRGPEAQGAEAQT